MLRCACNWLRTGIGAVFCIIGLALLMLGDAIMPSERPADTHRFRI